MYIVIVTIVPGHQGEIVSCDEQLVYLHGYDSEEEVTGSPITDLIPALRLPGPDGALTKVTRGGGILHSFMLLTTTMEIRLVTSLFCGILNE